MASAHSAIDAVTDRQLDFCRLLTSRSNSSATLWYSKLTGPAGLNPGGFSFGCAPIERTSEANSDRLTPSDRSPNCDDDASADKARDQVTKPVAKGHT